MRETLWRRLEALEEIRKMQKNGPVRIAHISFVDAYGRPVEATVANGPGGFICRRAIGEELDASRPGPIPNAGPPIREGRSC